MNRVLFLIDGFNVYHSLANKNYSKYKWLDYSALAKCFLTQKDKIVQILFFTAYTYWNPDRIKRHKKLTQALTSNGVRIIEGKFKKKDVYINISKEIFRQKNITVNISKDISIWRKSHEEKLTDVNIAISLFQSSVHNEYDTAMIMTADTDIIPAIRAVKADFSQKRIEVIFPIGRYTKDLDDICDAHKTIKETHLQSSQFPNTVIIDKIKGLSVTCPRSWK